jgi:tryptophanyl-tRNA synthetase
VARVLSGIKPTGEIHLGNYLGAVRHWVAAQDDAATPDDALYCVVDLHALTVPWEVAGFADVTRNLAMVLMAAGLDPARCTLFVQSHVPEVTELTWLLNAVGTFGELRRMTQFKDKTARGGEGSQESLSVAFFDYPVLMAADVLLYDTDEVPVGDDQRQHVELARDLAIRFNRRFGDTFVVPKAVIAPEGARIMDLQRPDTKMSKSDDSPQGTLGILDPPDAVAKRIRSAVTDSDGEVRFDPDAKPGVSNLLSILAGVTGRAIADVAAEHAGSGYGTLKGAVADAVVELLTPIQARYAALAADPAEVDRILAAGATRVEALARPVLARARDATGLLPRAGDARAR